MENFVGVGQPQVDGESLLKVQSMASCLGLRQNQLQIEWQDQSPHHSYASNNVVVVTGISIGIVDSIMCCRLF